MSPLMISQPELAQQAQHYLSQGHYSQAIALYEQLIELYPEERIFNWLLGLSYLLNDGETEAQMAWAVAMVEAEDEAQSRQWSLELVQVLESEAVRQTEQENYPIAWSIRQYLYQVDPSNINNILNSLLLLTHLVSFSIEQFVEQLIASEITSYLQSVETKQSINVDFDLLLEVMQFALKQGYEYSAVFEFIEASAAYLPTETVIEPILDAVSRIGYIERNYQLACRYGEICLKLAPDHRDVLAAMSYFFIFIMKYEEAVQLAKRLFRLCETLSEKVKGSAAVLRCLMRAGGNWEESLEWLNLQKQMLDEWLDICEADPDQVADANLLTAALFYLPYFEDAPQETRQLLNRISNLSYLVLDRQASQAHGADYRQKFFPPRRLNDQKRPLRIAYISSFLRRHSIGWLARWLLEHHDRDRFEVQVYFTQQSEVSAFSQKWYASKASKAACFYGDPLVLAQAIYDNEVDILVDLDSLTVDSTTTALLLKPAPIQVSWLGWDASGLPTIDYYIADHYVLPTDAQEYYIEKIWRMPTTYLAVDGFEVGIPNIRRDTLNIPMDAVIYFSSQTGQKRNPDNIRTQLKILRQVPNSYFLIKGFADATQVTAMFEKLAAEEGVPFDRLRFLPPTPDEETHRANLSIADVVLDTFPYNGATTTLETLWMGIPIVTKVGQQFAARNSYGMMMNAGIQEGIAWNNEEYIEWGVRFGTDPALRQQISWQLKQSRQTAPLWNGKQFTRNMEAAFEQMWQSYLQQQG